MGTVNVTLGEDTRLNLILGQQLENAVTSVVFDFSAWQTAYGSGTLALSVQRPGDEQPYAVTMTTSGTDATWSVTDLDTAYKGVGHIQLTYTVGSAIKKSVVYKFTVYESLGANGEYPSPGQTWQEEIEDELSDVKQDLNDLQEEIEGGGIGMSEEFKQALHDILEKVAYIDEDGQDYLDALDSAMWPPADLVSISAVYTQSGTVYDTDTLDSLKADLVVTAHYDDSTSQTVTTYTLSGTLVVGTSTITVTYGEKTATFTVTVSESWKTLIDNDITGWYYYSNASYSGDVITIAPTNVSWDNYAKPIALYQYSAIKNKRIRISGTVELTGYSSGKGFAIVPGTFTAPSGVSTRRAYLSLDDTQASTTGWLTTSGTFTFDTESLTLADVLDTGTTPTDTEWVNAIIYLNANSGCVATVTDVTIEYLD